MRETYFGHIAIRNFQFNDIAGKFLHPMKRNCPVFILQLIKVKLFMHLFVAKTQLCDSAAK